MTPHSWVTNIWQVVKESGHLFREDHRNTDVQCSCNSPSFPLAWKFSHHNPISLPTLQSQREAQCICSSPPFPLVCKSFALAQNICHHNPIILPACDIGLWWQNFCANWKGGLLQPNRASVIAQISQDPRKMCGQIFFTTSQMLVTLLCSVTSYMQSFYILLHKT